MTPDQLEQLADEAGRRFGRRPVQAARAPGRVNLIGEHTDYNGGLVLPCAIDRDTVALAGPRSDRRVRMWARDLGQEVELDPAAEPAPGEPGFARYLRGVLAALAERGLEPGGWDLAIASRVPRESGLSSSAALGVAIATVLDHAAGLGLGPLECARVAHRGESHFAGVGCGILDPFASALARAGALLRIDCASEQCELVPFPAGQALLLVAHSGVRRALGPGAGGGGRGYGDRVGECAAALEAARASGVVERSLPSLSALTPEEVEALAGRIPEASWRRIRHVVGENERVQAVVRVLGEARSGAGDDAGPVLEAVGSRLREGQASLRDDFEVSIPELDALCEIADARPGCFGSRLTGAGFGGCTLHLVARSEAEDVRRALEEGFRARFGRRPPVFAVTPAEGAGPLPVSPGRAPS